MFVTGAGRSIDGLDEKNRLVFDGNCRRTNGPQSKKRTIDSISTVVIGEINNALLVGGDVTTALRSPVVKYSGEKVRRNWRETRAQRITEITRAGQPFNGISRDFGITVLSFEPTGFRAYVPTPSRERERDTSDRTRPTFNYV